VPDADVGVTWEMQSFDFRRGWAVQYSSSWRPQVHGAAVRRQWRPGGWLYQLGAWQGHGPPPYWLQVEMRQAARRWLASPKACRSRYRHQQIRPRIV